MWPFLTAVFLTLLLTGLPGILAVPSLIPISGPKADRAKSDGYIVTLKPGRDVSRHRSSLTKAGVDLNASVRHQYRAGYAGSFSAKQLNALRASKDVESIERDAIGGVDDIIIQRTAPWGLQRLSQISQVGDRGTDELKYRYTYDESAGEGVDIYIVDTGVKIDHVDFGGRASWGITLAGTDMVDLYGHGSHVAGTAAGTQFGVAKKANVIAVKTIDDSGNGYTSDTIAGIEWVMAQAAASGRPSIINISLHFGPTDALDSTIDDATAAGVHVVTSAGNSASDASSQSPARASSAIAVGASTIYDFAADYSNYGPKVAFYAPGSDVVSCGIEDTNSTAVMSGTSMASPHVAGLMAYLIGFEGSRTPDDLLARLRELAFYGVLDDIPANTTNNIVDNGIQSLL